MGNTSETSLYHILDDRIYFQKVRTFIFERVLFIPSEASKECLKKFFVFSTLMKKKMLINKIKLIKYEFSHCLFNQGFWILHRIQSRLLRFKKLSIYPYLGVLIFVISFALL